MKTNMKRTILCAAVSLSCLTAFPAFAEVTKEEYKTESAEIREQCKEVKAQIDALRQANEAIKERYKTMKSSIKEDKELPETITPETWKQLASLRQQVNAEKAEENSDGARESSKPAEGEKKNSAVKAAVQSGDYEAALEFLNTRLAERKAMLENLQAKHEIWQQIDDLIN